MGITVVQKSDLTVKKKNPKIALVLAGGAVSGGAYKLGGLKALNDLMVNKDVSDFDVFVGLSAGALLVAPLAAGISTEEMLKSFDGRSERFRQLRWLDFYNPNISELVGRPLDFVFRLATAAPRFYIKFLTELLSADRQFIKLVTNFLKSPNYKNADMIAKNLVKIALASKDLPSVLDILPSGIFDNTRLERYVRRNVKRNNLKNSFSELHRKLGKELYITALNLDTAERVVFGHDEDDSLSISEAIQASTALPGFYKPARIRGIDYIDGGVTTTANVDVAVKHGADLVIVYNPFRPFYNKLLIRFYKDLATYQSDKPYIADGGVYAVLNQSFRVLLHHRLQMALKRFEQNPEFKGDIVLVEPDLFDINFFEINPLAFWERARAAELGYLSVKQSIEKHYPLVKKILASYSIDSTMMYIDEDAKKIQSTPKDDAIIGILGKSRIKRDIRLVM